MKHVTEMGMSYVAKIDGDPTTVDFRDRSDRSTNVGLAIQRRTL